LKIENMKKLIHILLGCLLVAGFGCRKNNYATDYKDFYDGHEIVYTGAVGFAVVQPGNLELGLKWKASPDPSITRYVVYYNNGADSQVVNITGKQDTIRTVIKNLAEYTYSFTIYSYDAKGNKSIPYEVNNAKVYGPLYAATLLNRGYDAVTPYVLNDNGSLTLNFITPDTINIKTVINYTNGAGLAAATVLKPDQSAITLPSYKAGTEIKYKSYYIPQRTSIDTFAVAQFDVFPKIYTYVECDKSLFKDDASLPNDVYAAYGTSLSKLWDGSAGPQAYPNIFHTDEDHGIPHTFTFDMGKVYNNLARLEETGRDGYHNPADFEVWGIADITNAATTLQANNSGWKAEMISKGWTLLKECVRSDDGNNPVRFDLNSNPPAVRYIRIRVVKTVDFAGNPKGSNWGELTFWNKQ
jgi:hypothetical protein